MATLLLGFALALVAGQGTAGQTTTGAVKPGGAKPKVEAPRPASPDVLITRLEEATDAEKAFNEGRLAPDRLLVIRTAKPTVAVYGRLARELRERRAQSIAVRDLVKGGDPETMSPESLETLRRYFAASPAKYAFQSMAAAGTPFTFQVLRGNQVVYTTPRGPLPTIVSEDPLGKPMTLSVDRMRLAALPTPQSADPEGPWRSDSSVACLVPARSPGPERTRRMQTGLQALAAREDEDFRTLEEILPGPSTDVINEAERRVVREDLLVSFKSAGYASRSEAEAAFPSLELQKYSKIVFQMKYKDDQGENKTFTWTALNLPTR